MLVRPYPAALCVPQALAWTLLAISSAAAHASEIEEVVVTAQKIERSLQETKESIAIFSAPELDRRGLQTLEDVYNQTANAFDLANNEGFGIRGVTNNSGSTLGGDGELATYFIDNVAITGFGKRFVPMDLWDIEQVEILRGPQSTNLGRNAMVGAVFITSKRPTIDAFESSVLIGLGNASKYEAAGMVNVPIADRAALRLSAEYLESDGFITNRTRDEDDFDARENLTLRAKLLLEPTEDLSIYGTVQYVESERGQNIFRFDLIDDLDDRENLGLLDDSETLEGWMATLDVGYQLTERWALRSITSFFDTDYDRLDDDDLSPAGGNAFRGREAFDTNWGEELRVDYRGDTLRGTVGLYYTNVQIENRTTGLVNIDPALVGVPPTLLPFYPSVIEIAVNTPFEGDTDNFALFTEWDWDVTPNWILSGGLRYETEQQDNDARVANTLVDPNALPDPVAAGAQATALFGPVVGAQVQGGVMQINGLLNSQLVPSEERTEPDFDVVLFKAGATWLASDSLNYSFFFSQGYRAGGAELSLSGRRSDYDPEYLDNFELSMRATLLDGAATLNANAYYGIWRDQQVTIGQSGSVFDTIIENAAESKIYGGELEFRLNPSDAWVGYISVGYSQTEFDDYESVVDGDLSGNDFAFSPNWTAAVGGTWYFGNGFYAGANVTWQTESYSDVQNTFELDERTLLSVQAGYENDRYRIALFGKNLTDELYLTAFNTGLTPGEIVGRVGEPREYGLQFTAHFR